MSVINYAFANIANGKVVLGDSYADTDKAYPGDCWNPGCKRGNFNQLNKLKIENPGLQTMISVGGWTWSTMFSDVALTEASRETFADSAVEFVQQWGFNGLDIDWEYPVKGGQPSNHHRPADKENFVSLLQLIRSKFDAASKKDGQKYLMSIASTANFSLFENYEFAQISETVDWINMMSYDFHGPFGGDFDKVTGMNSALAEDPKDPEPADVKADFNLKESVKLMIEAGVPKQKINAGLAFYGHGYGNVANTNNGLYSTYKGVSPVGTWQNGVFDFSDLKKKYINLNGYKKYFDEAAQVPWLYNPEKQIMISYDDEQSIGLKADFVNEIDIGGAMFWEFSCDRNAELLDTVYSKFNP